MANREILTVGEVRMITFFRRYPHMAAKMIMSTIDGKVDLPEFQMLILYTVWLKLFPIIVVSRGGGKTFIQGIIAILESLLQRGYKVGIISSSFRQAKFVFAEVDKIYSKSPILQQAAYKKPTIKTDIAYTKWRHGGEISALPLGTGEKIRGARFNTILTDEAAQVPVEIYDVVVLGFIATILNPMKEVRRREKIKELEAKGIKTKSVGARENKICMFSSAYYQFNHLWETIQQRLDLIRSQFSSDPKDYDNYAIVKIPYQKIPDGFMSTKSVEMAKNKMSSHEFRMEYETIFLSDSDGYFPMSILEKARSLKYVYKQEGIPGKQYILGVDPARDSANCAFCVIQIGELEPHTIVCMETLNGKSFPIIHKKILELSDRYDISYILIDKGGGGSAIKDMLCDPEKMKNRPLIWDVNDELSYLGGLKTRPRPGRHILYLVNFTPSWISDANNNLLAAFEKGHLVFASGLEMVENISMLSESYLKFAEYQDIEFISSKRELSRIVVTLTKSGVPHWDTEGGRERKDRYSAILIAYDAIRLINEDALFNNRGDLAEGGWVGKMDSRRHRRASYFQVASLTN